ncbi:hypothetical protein ACNPNM_06460 [Klebsiella variicola]|uniref:hypothetical protein n=1 Tax=Klebsiella pneumoniae complex TaxID=3390273 RepID=UPI000C600A30|nr:hypothetical protein BKN43_02335 [Klebsiella quasipneumoniae]HBT0028284.1 hypothetical protein [Klebsiella pneumoniae]HBT0050655.1 hypothetical protein [Klebsiella pneumoniae]HBT0138344.1 hypothetical protein [Klebsiella pneumoniae]
MSQFLKIGIYGIWGVFLFLASMEKFGDLFAVGTGIWSVAMLTVAGVCQILASTAAIGWAVLGSGTLKAKYLPYKFINNYTVPVLIIGLAIVASTARDSSDEIRAQKLGFKDGKEFAIARENNIFNVADYAKFAEEQRSKAAEKEQQDKNAKIIEEYVTIFTDSDSKEKARELIKNDLKVNSELTKQILKEISSYDERSVDRTVSELDYIDKGVSYKQFMSAIEHSECRENYNNSIFPIDEYYKSQQAMRVEQNRNTNWNMMPSIERKQFLYDGDRLTMAYFKEKTPVQNRFSNCTFNLLKTIPHLSRPNARPHVEPEYIPPKIKCVRENNGNIDMCY